MSVVKKTWDWLEVFASDPRKLLILDLAIGAMLLLLTAVFIFFLLQTHGALCTLRGDLQDRVDRSKAYLAEHPGDLKFGDTVIPRSQFESQVANQEATLKSLDELHC